MFDDVAFLPIDRELLPAASTLQRASGFLRQRRPRTTVRTHAVGSPKMRRGLTIFRGSFHHAPALRGPLLDLEPGAQYTDLAMIDFYNCLKISELDDAVQCTAAHLEGDIGLEAGKQDRHHGSW